MKNKWKDKTFRSKVLSSQKTTIYVEGLQGRPFGSYSRLRKIRCVTKNNSTGDSFAINVPRELALHFTDTKFTCAISGNSIIFESGCKT